MGIKNKMESKPKRPLSGYMIFGQAERAAHTGEDKITFKMIGDKWASLDEDEKKKFNEPQQELMEQYKEDLKVWKEANSDVVEEEKSRGKSRVKKSREPKKMKLPTRS